MHDEHSGTEPPKGPANDSGPATDSSPTLTQLREGTEPPHSSAEDSGPATESAPALAQLPEVTTPPQSSASDSGPAANATPASTRAKSSWPPRRRRKSFKAQQVIAIIMALPMVFLCFYIALATFTGGRTANSTPAAEEAKPRVESPSLVSSKGPTVPTKVTNRVKAEPQTARRTSELKKLTGEWVLVALEQHVENAPFVKGYVQEFDIETSPDDEQTYIIGYPAQNVSKIERRIPVCDRVLKGDPAAIMSGTIEVGRSDNHPSYTVDQAPTATQSRATISGLYRVNYDTLEFCIFLPGSSLAASSTSFPHEFTTRGSEPTVIYSYRRR